MCLSTGQYRFMWRLMAKGKTNFFHQIHFFTTFKAEINFFNFLTIRFFLYLQQNDPLRNNEHYDSTCPPQIELKVIE